MNSNILGELLSKRGVVSIGRGYKKVGGISTGKICIVVGVIKKLSPKEIQDGTWVKLKRGSPLFVNSEDNIPATIGKEETDVIEIGEIDLL